MNLALASTFLVGSVAAFAPTFATRPWSALKMSTVETPTYTFAKSEEIFAEAQTVSRSTVVHMHIHWHQH